MEIAHLQETVLPQTFPTSIAFLINGESFSGTWDIEELELTNLEGHRNCGRALEQSTELTITRK